MVGIVDSVERGPGESGHGPAEIDFGGQVDFEARQARPRTETLSGPSGGVGVHDVPRLCRRTSLSVAVSVASLS